MKPNIHSINRFEERNEKWEKLMTISVNRNPKSLSIKVSDNWWVQIFSIEMTKHLNQLYSIQFNQFESIQDLT